MRYELNDYEWSTIKPMLPNKPRGVRRVNDRRVLNGIFWVLRSGAPWRQIPGDVGVVADRTHVAAETAGTRVTPAKHRGYRSEIAEGYLPKQGRAEK